MSNFAQLKQIIIDIEADATKLYEKGNVAAGKRLRKAMQDARKLAAQIRKDVLDVKNSKKSEGTESSAE